MEKPNPNDPTMVDVYNDETGQYETTLPNPAAQDPSTGELLNPGTPATNPVAAVANVGNQFRATVGAGPLATPQAPAPNMSVQPPAAPNMSVAPPELNMSVAPLQPGAADSLPTTELPTLEPGFADMIPGTEGGMQVSQQSSSGIDPARSAELQGMLADNAEAERGAVLDEALAKEIETTEAEKLHAQREAEVKEEQAKIAIALKLEMDRRNDIEQKISAVRAEEPDRNRVYPKGFALIATYIGAIAGGMLQGLQGGQNLVIDALNHKLDQDVQQQRESQSVLLKDLTRQLGSQDAAVDILRAKQKEVVLKEYENRLQGAKLKAAPAQNDAFKKRMNAEITRHYIDGVVKLERDKTIQEVNTPSTSPQAFNAKSYLTGTLNKYAEETGLKPNQAHEQWINYNKTFVETAAVRGALQTAQRAIDRYQESGDVAGFGFLGEKVPSQLAGKDAVQVRQVIGTLMSARIKQLSGSAASEGEVGRIRDALLGPGSFDSMKQGLNAMAQEFKNIEDAKQDENPTFFEMRQNLRQLNSAGAARSQQYRSEQQGHTADVVSIPDSSAIAKAHNNPGNLVYVGQKGAERGEPKDGGGYWAKFPTVNDGMVALVRQVQLDQSRNFNVRQFVSKYAPKKDANDVEGYIGKLGARLGVDEQTNISDIDPKKLAFALADIESSSKPRGK